MRDRWILLLGAVTLSGCGDAGSADAASEATGGAAVSAGSGGLVAGGTGGMVTGGHAASLGGSSGTNVHATGGTPATGGTSSGGTSIEGSGGAGLGTGGTTSSGGASRGGGGASGSGGAGLGTGGLTGSGGAATGGGGSASGGTSGYAATGGGGSASGGAEPGGAAGTGTGGSGACDLSEPPSEVADWVEESWDAEGRNNITNQANWLFDAAMLGGGTINVCVRYGATSPVTAEMRDAWGPTLERLFNTWFGLLHPYACFPYERVSVTISGWAVKPGQEHLLQWSDDSIPIYTEVSDGSDQAAGEPKCPDACGFFFRQNWDHVFADCPGGLDNHFDYSLWLNDTGPGGATAHGSSWGIRMAVSGFVRDTESGRTFVEWHEIGHAFGLSDYYTWTGSVPEGGSVMITNSGAASPSLGDQWMVRRYFKEARALRYADE